MSHKEHSEIYTIEKSSNLGDTLGADRAETLWLGFSATCFLKLLSQKMFSKNPTSAGDFRLENNFSCDTDVMLRASFVQRFAGEHQHESLYNTAQCLHATCDKNRLMNDGVNIFLIFDYDTFMMVEVYEVILECVLLYRT